MSSNDPQMQPLQDGDSTSAGNPDADAAQREWVDPESQDERPGGEPPTAEQQPETQGTEPLIAELGKRGEGDLGPNDLME